MQPEIAPELIPDLVAFVPKTEYSRRDFVMTSLASGFAAAVLPVSAQTITTDSKGLTAGEVKIPVKDGQVPGYRAMPAGGKNLPVVLVVQEIFGVHEHIKDLCRRLAKMGYFAIAPELYSRQGDVSKLQDFQDIFKIVKTVPDAQVMSDLDSAVDFAKKSGKADTAKLAITGFCWGGSIVWLYSAHNKDLKAGIAWYGRLVGDKDDLHPQHPTDVAKSLHAPVLGLYGGADMGIPESSIEAMRTELKGSKTGSEIHVYPETPHGFNADYRPSYRKEQAEDGWKRMHEWLKNNGVS